ncbi:hypothetical protein BC826DRAFT_1003385 [Russula brevipes]|nr:hypothetical protein BC826DRAFT_1003385 [Russula brevipes]
MSGIRHVFGLVSATWISFLEGRLAIYDSLKINGPLPQTRLQVIEPIIPASAPNPPSSFYHTRDVFNHSLRHGWRSLRSRVSRPPDQESIWSPIRRHCT